MVTRALHSPRAILPNCTSVSITVWAVNAAGQSAAASTGGAGTNCPPPPGKSLTVDATSAFGTCVGPNNPPFCGGDAHAQPDPNFVAGRGVDQAQGTVVTAVCWTVGG